MRHAFALALLTALLAWPATQEPSGGGQEPLRPATSPATRRKFQKDLEAMQGCWQLIDIDLPAAHKEGRQEVAFLLVSQEFMSIEFHMGFFGDEEDLEESYFQSGTYRLAADERGYLSTTTLIGSVFDEEERLIFEPPGLKRFYSVETKDKTLTLIRFPDRARFVFSKLATLADHDFYGRPIPKQEDQEEAEEPPKGRRPGR